MINNIKITKYTITSSDFISIAVLILDKFYIEDIKI